MKKYTIVFILLLVRCSTLLAAEIIISGTRDNDLYVILNQSGISTRLVTSPLQAVSEGQRGDAVIITAPGYPLSRTVLTQTVLNIAKKKKLRLYIEYPNFFPNIEVPPETLKGVLERGVVSSDFFGKSLPEMSLLGLNGVHLIPIKTSQISHKPLLNFAKVAGFDHAVYGLSDTDVYPLLFQQNNTLIATTCLSNFNTARFAPVDSWKKVWTKIIEWMTGEENIILQWQPDPCPTYNRNCILPFSAETKAVKRSAEWLFNARFFVHPVWWERTRRLQDVDPPTAPKVSSDEPVGDGSLGIIEGHMSVIDYDGSQQYRYTLRPDEQGEAIFLLASAGDLLNNEKYFHTAEKLMDYVFYVSPFRQGMRNDPKSSSYGCLSFAYGDCCRKTYYSSATTIIGMLGASALMNNQRWNRLLVETVLSTFRTTGKQGFRGGCCDDKIGAMQEDDLKEKGWQYYFNRDIINPHPHFEAWPWACYLWMYHHTGYRPFLEKTKNAIRLTMEAYPDGWKWTNGIQQERARMLLPLAWLVRVEDTPQHREWLDCIVQEIISNQHSTGAIREELGNGVSGFFGKTRSNADYGKHEAPLIAENGDPVADMLYTNNFAFFGLNEAAHATGNPQYYEATRKLSDFLLRIQVKSTKHKDLDGAWFRAFDYNRWDYWASNADVGWGAWSTLAGWSQTWITVTLALREKQTNFWDITQKLDIVGDWKASEWMLNQNNWTNIK